MSESSLALQKKREGARTRRKKPPRGQKEEGEEDDRRGDLAREQERFIIKVVKVQNFISTSLVSTIWVPQSFGEVLLCPKLEAPLRVATHVVAV